MDESIYALIPQPVDQPVKQPMYRSKHPPTQGPTFSTFGLTGTSMPGYVNVGGEGPAPAPSGAGVHTYKKSAATFGKLNNKSSPADILQKGTGLGGGATQLSAPGQAPPTTKAPSASKKPSVPTAAALAADYAAKPAR